MENFNIEHNLLIGLVEPKASTSVVCGNHVLKTERNLMHYETTFWFFFLQEKNEVGILE